MTTQALHAAVFDSDSNFLRHIVIPVTRPRRDFYVVFADIPNAHYIRVFMWDSLETMDPISGAEPPVFIQRELSI